MGGKRFRTGSVSVLFAVIMLCVAVLAALTVSTASGDRRTAHRYGEYVQRLTECQNEGQRWLAEADAYLRGAGELPDGTHQNESEISTEITSGNMTLTIRLAVEGETYEITAWSLESQWQPEEERWSLWHK